MITLARPDGTIVTPLTADNGQRYQILGERGRFTVHKDDAELTPLTRPGSYAAQLDYCESIGCRVRGDL